MPHAVQINWSRGLVPLGESFTEEDLVVGGDVTSGRALGDRLDGPAPPSAAPVVAAAGLLLLLDLWSSSPRLMVRAAQ